LIDCIGPRGRYFNLEYNTCALTVRMMFFAPLPGTNLTNIELVLRFALVVSGLVLISFFPFYAKSASIRTPSLDRKNFLNEEETKLRELKAQGSSYLT